MKKIKGKIGLFVLEIIMILFSMVIIFPFLMMILGSLKTPMEAAQFNLKLPDEWHFENYVYVIKEGNLIRAFGNSVLITFTTVVAVLTVSSMCAFIISRKHTKGAQRLYRFFLICMIAPFQVVTTLAFMKIMGLVGTYLSVIIVDIALNIPFSVFIFTGFIKGIPRELDEAAVVDGCKPVRAFFQIILPLLRPVFITDLVIVAMSAWNDFMIPLYFLNRSSKWTMPLTVYGFYGQYYSNWNYVFADLILTALPVLILYLFAQKYIIAGMTAGSVKG